MSNVENLIIGSQAPGKAHQAGEASGRKGAPSEDVMALAYYYLVEASMITTETALVQAKQTKANGLAQEQLNKQAGALQWYSVQNLKSTHHSTLIKHTHWTWKFWIHGGFEYVSYQLVTWTTHKNQLTVFNEQTKNEQIAADRQFLTQKMGILQQSASVDETHINSISDESTQTMQESSMILKIIQSLTFKAMLRRQPRT